MKIIFSAKCLEYQQEGHPESPARVRKAYEFLKKKNYVFIKAKSCSAEDLLLVHSKKHVDDIKKENFFDPDTPVLPGIYEYAKLSAGAAIQAADYAASQENAFSLMRPPGHHATKDRAMGFCYFNNMTIAVAKLLKQQKIKKISKIAILDIDVHHGNGTQDIFLGNEQVLYASLHQVPLYPGTGLRNEKNCFNYALRSGTDEKVYLSTLEKALCEIKNFKPDLLGISAGFDTYKEEMLASFKLEISSYKKIARAIKKLKLPCFIVLEGGYTDKLGECIDEFLTELD